MSLDTLALAKELRAAELSSTQAEAIAAAIGRAVLEGSATKADVQLVRSDVDLLRGELKSGFHQLRTEMEMLRVGVRGDIEKLRSSLLTYFIATIVSLAMLIIAVVKL